jgi:hypothetical protein
MQPPARCANLTPQTQDRRLRLGIVFFTITVVAAVVLVKLHAHPALRWALAVPFFCATLHIAEAMYKTCPMLAARGMREQAEGSEPIADPRERSRIRGNGRRLLVSSAVIALTAAALFAQLSPA